MKIRLFWIASMCFLIMLLLLSYNMIINEAFAHVEKKFGNIQVQVGWNDEPPMTGLLNNVIVGVNQTNGKSQTPIINTLANMNIQVKYGSITKPIEFLPSPIADGVYNSQLIPTRVGSYYLLLNGTIQGQKINSQIPLDLVDSSQKLNFPSAGQTSGAVSAGTGGTTTTTTASNNIGPELQGIVSQLANQIDSAKNVIGGLAKNDADTIKSIQDVKNAADRSCMIAMVGIGAGIAGIVIAAYSISRKHTIEP